MKSLMDIRTLGCMGLKKEKQTIQLFAFRDTKTESLAHEEV